MIYRAGRVLDRRKKDIYSYYHGHLIKPKRKLPRVLMAFAMLILLPCFGVWLATSNFSMQPEQVAAEVGATVVTPTVQEPEKLPQTGPGSETNPEVQRYLHEWTQTNSRTSWAVYVEQLGSNKQVASVNADKQLPIASLYKLFVPNILAGIVPPEQWSKQSTSSTEGRTLDRCVRDMLQVSDNSCGNALAEKIGWNALSQQVKSAGYVFTNLNSVDYLKGTARDVASLLKDLQTKNAFSDPVRDRMLAAMKDQRLNKGIPAGCAGCVVYNKTGDAEGFRNDAAIIESQGKTYVLVIMSKGGTYQQIADLTKGVIEKFNTPAE